MKHKRLARLVRNRPEKYPHELERHYERVLDRIMAVWGTPKAEQYFLDLLVDGRGTRSGFPVKVAEEIYFLSELHTLTHDSKGEARIGSETQRLAKADQRTAEFRTVLEERGFKFVPTEMFACISKGDLANVVMFVNAGMSVDTLNDRGWTPLMVALFEGQEKVALFLIKRGADPFFCDATGPEPFGRQDAGAHRHRSRTARDRRDAAQGGRRRQRSRQGGDPPLHIAAERNDVALIELLLASGARRSARDKRGVTPLLRAVEVGAIAAIRRLLAAGARIDETLDARPEEKAVDSARPGRVGSVISSATRVAKGIRMDRRYRLHDYVANNDFLGVRTEVGKGVDPNAVGPDGMTPLEVAAAHGHRQMWGVLIDLGAGRRLARS